MTRATALAALVSVLGCSPRTQVGPDAPAARRPPPVWTADGRVLGVERSVPDAPATYASIVVHPGDEVVSVQPAPGWSLESGSHDARVYPSTIVASTSSSAGVPARPDQRACVSFSAEARFRNHAHDHVVHLLSRCRTSVLCAVSTDVNRSGVDVDVKPSEHVEVITFRGSPAREFEARVHCAWRERPRE
jgi:hypothetical protein